MINFNQNDSIGLGNSGSGPWIPKGFCILGDYIILTLADSVSEDIMLQAYSVNNATGQMALAGSYYALPPFPVYSGGVFTDGVYIYRSFHGSSASVRGTTPYTFDGSNFVQGTVNSNIYADHGNMTFGGGYIFMGSTVNFENPAEHVLAAPFDGTIWGTPYKCDFTILHSSYDIYNLLPEYPLYYSEGGPIGIRTDSGISPGSVYFEDTIGFTDFRTIGGGGLGPTVHFIYEKGSISQSIYEAEEWALFNNTLTVNGSVAHEYSPGLPTGLAYHNVYDNLIMVCTPSGLHAYEAEGSYHQFGVYESTKEFHFYFKFKQWEFFIANDVVGGELQMVNGNFYYAPEFTSGLFATPRLGSNPLTVSFIDITT